MNTPIRPCNRLLSIKPAKGVVGALLCLRTLALAGLFEAWASRP